uniref:Col_cuticle_N domain-containing protein n=1 Tax=Steinernema glaseri TaxID=37863 RepID=A0A1I8AK29_9BILA
MTAEDQWEHLHVHFRRPPNYDGPRIHNILIMVSTCCTIIFSLGALTFAWLSFNEVYFNTNRMLLRFEEKIKLGGEFTARRQFPEYIFDRLGYIADFDVDVNSDEINSILKSLSPSSGRPSPRRNPL